MAGTTFEITFYRSTFYGRQTYAYYKDACKWRSMQDLISWFPFTFSIALLLWSYSFNWLICLSPQGLNFCGFTLQRLSSISLPFGMVDVTVRPHFQLSSSMGSNWLRSINVQHTKFYKHGSIGNPILSNVHNWTHLTDRWRNIPTKLELLGISVTLDIHVMNHTVPVLGDAVHNSL